MLQKQGVQPNHRSLYRPPLSDSVRSSRGVSRSASPLPTYLRMAQLAPGIVPVSQATIWRWVKAGNFPAPIKLADRVTAWKLEEVIAWLESRQTGMA